MNRARSTLSLLTRWGKKSLTALVATRSEFKTWRQNKPKPISLYPGEKEIFRQGPVLVTDTRISHIDPFDRILKTYMFEHMISVNKNFYHASARTRRFCISLIILVSLTLLFTFVVDLMGDSSRRFAPVYIPLLISLLVGLIVWRDMRPKYRVEWIMRNGPPGGIKTEPLLREWLLNNNGREQFMNKLVEAMNQAIAGKAWWPHRQPLDQVALEQVATDTTPSDPTGSETQNNTTPNTHVSDTTENVGDARRRLKLVTDNYQ